nr:laminin-like protein epi-1 [Penaeus vannamei]
MKAVAEASSTSLRSPFPSLLLYDMLFPSMFLLLLAMGASTLLWPFPTTAPAEFSLSFISDFLLLSYVYLRILDAGVHQTQVANYSKSHRVVFKDIASSTDPCPDLNMQCNATGGYCNHECMDDEVALSGLCRYDNCSCCVRETEPCPDLEQQCLSRHGYCNHTCLPDEMALSGFCKYDNCSCCVKETADPCPDLNMQCNATGGYCNHDCKSDEVALSGLCRYDNCSCCVKA